MVLDSEDERENGGRGTKLRSVRVKIEPRDEDEKGEVKREDEEEEETVETLGRLKTLYVAIPLETKTGSEVKGATQSVIARLNSAGMAVRRVHTTEEQSSQRKN